MKKTIFIGGMLIILISCTSPEKQNFQYIQNFNPESYADKDQSTRLVFDDVREETRLSFWRTASWVPVENGVRVVRSRSEEVLIRDQFIEENYQGQESFMEVVGFRLPWLTLSMGNLNWCDYSVSTTVKFEKQSNAGIAFRYLNSREYYAFILDAKYGKAKFILRKMDQESTAGNPLYWTELQTVSYNFLPDRIYNIKAEVNDDNIECSIDNSIVIKYKDCYRKNGKVALIADDHVEFGPVTVKGKMYVTKETEIPKPAEIKLIYDLPLPGENIRRNFCFLDPDSDGENEIIIVESNGDKFAYRCLEFDGTELWKIDDFKYPTNEGGDFTLQVFDINGDGKNEIITAIDFQIQVRDGKTARVINSVSTPKQNPYFDSRNYKYPKLLGDAICPVKFDADKPPGFYIKDRYTNIWMFDNNLNQLWHKALSTGHFPLPVDIDNDGIDEIMVNYTLLRADGSVIWKLPLWDHADNIGYVSLNPGKEPKYIYLAGGDMGLLQINPADGEIIRRLQLGHIQSFTVADFLPEKEGLELMTQTHWREDQIHYLFDKDLNMVSTWEGDFTGKMYPVQWGNNENELLFTPNGLVDPLTGQVIYSPFRRVVSVFSDKRWGNVLIATLEDNYLKIYSSSNDSELYPAVFSYSEYQSAYLPVCKISLINKVQDQN